MSSVRPVIFFLLWSVFCASKRWVLPNLVFFLCWRKLHFVYHDPFNVSTMYYTSKHQSICTCSWSSARIQPAYFADFYAHECHIVKRISSCRLPNTFWCRMCTWLFLHSRRAAFCIVDVRRCATRKKIINIGAIQESHISALTRSAQPLKYESNRTRH